MSKAQVLQQKHVLIRKYIIFVAFSKTKTSENANESDSIWLFWQKAPKSSKTAQTLYTDETYSLILWILYESTV